jgi:hypothetical protein
VPDALPNVIARTLRHCRSAETSRHRAYLVRQGISTAIQRVSEWSKWSTNPRAAKNEGLTPILAHDPDLGPTNPRAARNEGLTPIFARSKARRAEENQSDALTALSFSTNRAGS